MAAESLTLACHVTDSGSVPLSMRDTYFAAGLPLLWWMIEAD